MAKKYERYKITVQYLNGDSEDINLMGINTSSYSKMLTVYHRIKNTYAEKVKIIDFVGIGQDGGLKVMWTKEIKSNGREELRQDINDIMINISKEILLIKDKNFYHYNLIDTLNKKYDLMKHELEGVHKIKFRNETEKDKKILKIGKEMEEILIERRWHKDQLFLINKLSNERVGNESINFTHLSNIFKVKCVKPIMKPLNMKLAEELNLYKEEPIKDKEKQIERLKKSYERIVIDEFENKLICYNKAKVI